MGDQVLNSRSDREPPPSWIAEVLAALKARFPRADLRTAAVKELYPGLREHWRRGQTSRQAAMTYSSCDNKTLQAAAEPGPAPRVRAPKEAKPGEVFGVESIRDPVAIARLVHKVARLESQVSTLAAKRRSRELFGGSSDKQRERETELEQSVTEARSALLQARQQPPLRQPRQTKARGASACPPKQAACKLGLLGGSCGLPAPLVLAAAQGAPIVRSARYCLTSAALLIPSHDPSRGFVVNPRYPRGVQERAYDRDKAEQLKVIGISQNLVPALIFNGAPGAIDGLPVVTADGVVLGGNGRTMGLQLHYINGGTEARNYLLDNARQFGFTKSQIQAVSDPVIVRVVDTMLPAEPGYTGQLRELVRLLNVPLVQSLDQRSESVAEAKRLSNEVFEILAVGLEDDMSLSEYLSSTGSRPLIAALRRSGVITSRNVARMIVPSGDSFSDEGRRQVERLLLAALVPDAALLDRLDGRVRESLARSAPWWLSAGAAGSDWDLRGAIGAAVRDLVDMRRESAPSVDAYLRQVRMNEPAAVQGVPLGERVLRLLDQIGTKPTALSKLARSFASSSRQHPSAQGSLLPSEKLSPAQALDRAAQVL